MHQTIAMGSEDGHASQSLHGDEEQRIRQELESILQHPLFARSKRYPKFLRFIIEKSLAQDFASLKERVIGIELLGKQSDYDNAADPEVRNIASEVRKRLVLYYQRNSGQQVRIELPAGSYIPVFQGLAQVEPDAAPVEAIPNSNNAEEEKPTASGTSLRFLFHHRRLLACAAILLLIGTVATIRNSWNSHTAATSNVLDRFWMPMFHSGSPVVVVLGTRRVHPESSGQSNTVVAPSAIAQPTVSIDSASALSRITVFLGAHGENYELHPAQETQYATLRGRPSVLIGGLNNAWGLRLLDHARYRMSYDGERAHSSIVDSTTGQSWIGPQIGLPESREHMDYAIVARQKDTTTGGAVIIAAGLGSAGTLAAAEFITNAAYLQQVNTTSLEQNVEFVLATNVIDTVPGPPHIVAMHSWH